MAIRKVDKVIIGAGIYGLYAALFCAEKGQEVVVLEMEDAPFKRATYINQARVHMGYHYPRSLSTAMKSAGYFKRFVEEFQCCIHSAFHQVYATSAHFSWTDAKEFCLFCEYCGIPCKELPAEDYFKAGVCDGAFLTQEYTYDALTLKNYFCGQLEKYKNVRLLMERQVKSIVRQGGQFIVYTDVWDGKRKVEERFEAPFVLNAAYASVNQILSMTKGIEAAFFDLKYELCEIILCRVCHELEKTGITVMDGPFFSIMPFGKTGYHSLTSVTFTPHLTSELELPYFKCSENGNCSKIQLGNCNTCAEKPQSAWKYMSALANKYLRNGLNYTYEKSLFSMKPILKASEIDDSRPTVVKFASRAPTFVSVLSGKINTIYDLDELLND